MSADQLAKVRLLCTAQYFNRNEMINLVIVNVAFGAFQSLRLALFKGRGGVRLQEDVITMLQFVIYEAFEQAVVVVGGEKCDFASHSQQCTRPTLVSTPKSRNKRHACTMRQVGHRFQEPESQLGCQGC